jgi:hypothetical protein
LLSDRSRQQPRPSPTGPPTPRPLPSRAQHRRAILILLGVTLVGVVAVIVHGPIPQSPSYHVFADQRRILGVPNFWNVASNIPFLVVGVAGLLSLSRRQLPGVLPALRPAYVAFFVGTALVSFGSGYYHSAPSDSSLVWDRLPMTVTFMAFLAILIGEQIGPEVGARLLLPLIVVGLLSVGYWWSSGRHGGGDLRPYTLVQFLPMALAPLLVILLPSRLTRVSLLWGVFAAYAVAKLLEALDRPIFDSLRVVSGHSLKHLAAALAAYLLLVAATKRRVLPCEGRTT